MIIPHLRPISRTKSWRTWQTSCHGAVRGAAIMQDVTPLHVCHPALEPIACENYCMQSGIGRRGRLTEDVERRIAIFERERARIGLATRNRYLRTKFRDRYPKTRDLLANPLPYLLHSSAVLERACLIAVKPWILSFSGFVG